MSAARQAERADQLQQGLTTNREIGAAVGILMATHSISNDEAFAMLSRASQHSTASCTRSRRASFAGDRPWAELRLSHVGMDAARATGEYAA